MDEPKIIVAPTRTLQQENDLIERAALAALKIFNKEPASSVYDIRYPVNELVKFFPGWNTSAKKKKISRLIRSGELGRCDREGRPTATIREFDNYLYNPKNSKS